MKVLLAIDGTTHSEAATERILNLDFPPNSEVRVVSVVNRNRQITQERLEGIPESLVAGKVATARQAQILCEKAARKIVQARSDKLDVSTQILYGAPDSRIPEAAQEWGADLIVVGSDRNAALKSTLPGSDSVVQKTPCLVLIVHKNKQCRVAFPSSTKYQ